jgi:uracil-DNA glycosylase
MTPINLEEIKYKLHDKLRDSGWANKLKTFILSSDFDYILQELYNQSSKGNKFTPPLKLIFRAFIECPFDNVKVVIVGQDPYPALGAADGLAFSCNNGKLQNSLKYIFKAIENTVYKIEGYGWDQDLTRWSKQGILLLNTALTTNVGEPGTHHDLWKPFTNQVIDALINNHTGIIYIFLGKIAQEWIDIVEPNNYVLTASHPVSALYGNNDWDCQDVFNKTNIILNNLYNQKIIW